MPSRQPDPLDPARRPRWPSTPTPRRTSTPWSRCRSAQAAPMRGPRPRTSGTGSASTTVTSQPDAARGGRHLGADEPGPDHDDPLAMPVVSAARSASESSSVRSTKTPSSSGWLGQPAGRRAGGDDHAVVGHGARRRPRSRPAPGRRAPVAVRPSRASQVERAEVAVLVRLAKVDALGLPLAGQHLLRQRRPVVGQVGLGADQGERGRRSPRSAASRPPADRPATRRRRPRPRSTPAPCHNPTRRPTPSGRPTPARRIRPGTVLHRCPSAAERRRPPLPERPKGREAAAELDRPRPAAGPPRVEGVERSVGLWVEQ